MLNKNNIIIIFIVIIIVIIKPPSSTKVDVKDIIFSLIGKTMSFRVNFITIDKIDDGIIIMY